MCDARYENTDRPADTPDVRPIEGSPADYDRRELSDEAKAVIAAVQKHADDHAYCIGLLELVADGHARNSDAGGLAVIELPASVMTEIYQTTGLSPRA